LFAC